MPDLVLALQMKKVFFWHWTEFGGRPAEAGITGLNAPKVP